MSTNSMISAKIGDKVKTIYCHWDGYLEWAGKILLEHYGTQEKVEALMELGWLSQLGASPGCPPGHSYDTPRDGYCVAFRRDRREDLDEDYNKGEWFGSWEESMEDRHEEYAYFWDGTQWWVSTEATEPPVPLSKMMERIRQAQSHTYFKTKQAKTRSYVNIEGEILDVEVQDRKYPTVSHGDREWYVFQDSESAGEAARGYWEEMARTDPEEFTYIVGQRNLVAWALGMWAGPGSKQVTSLKDWLDLWLGTPEEQWASYDGEEVEGTVSREAMGELGFKNKSVVFYRVS